MYADLTKDRSNWYMYNVAFDIAFLCTISAAPCHLKPNLYLSHYNLTCNLFREHLLCNSFFDKLFDICTLCFLARIPILLLTYQGLLSILDTYTSCKGSAPVFVKSGPLTSNISYYQNIHAGNSSVS